MGAGLGALLIFSLLGYGGFRSCAPEDKQEISTIKSKNLEVGNCICELRLVYKSKCTEYVHKVIDISEKEGKLLLVQGNLPNFKEYGWYGGYPEDINWVLNNYTPVECPKE